MNTSVPVIFTTVLQRKDLKLPVYVVVPHAEVAHWTLEATTMVEGTVNGHAFGRRSMKKLNATSHSDWFVEYTAPLCKGLGIKVGDELKVDLRLAATETPRELDEQFSLNPNLHAFWSSRSEYARRISAEHVRAGKTETTRLRRAQAIASKREAGKGS
jgi:hypothetical protein